MIEHRKGLALVLSALAIFGTTRAFDLWNNPDLKFLCTLAHFYYFAVIPPATADFSRVRLMRQTRSILDYPDDEGSHIAEVKILQDGLLTGRDVGTVSIIDDAVVFDGRATSFCIGAQDVGFGPEVDRGPTLVRNKDCVTVRLKSQTETLSVEMTLLNDFSKEVYQTLRGPIKTKVARSYPPKQLGKDIPRPTEWLRIQLYVLTVSGLIAILISERVSLSQIAVIAAGAFLYPALVFQPIGKARAKLNFYKRLRAERDSALTGERTA